MIPRIREVTPMPDFLLHVLFDDGKAVVYDVKEDMEAIDCFKELASIYGLFNQVRLDESRTCLTWTDRIDLPSDAIYEYGKPIRSRI